MYFAIKKLNSFINKYGFDLRATSLNFFKYYMQKFDKVDFLPSEEGIFSIPIEKCVAQSYFSYARDGWHYYDALVREYCYNNNLKYEDSILYKYYNCFNPLNCREALFDDNTLDGSVLSKLPNIALRDFWNLSGTLEQIKSYLKEEESQLFGPVNALYGEEQFRRCIRAYELIKKHSYVPDKFFDGYVKGFFIKNSSDYRFCVIAGKHRIAALNVLGYDKVKVKADYLLKVLDLDNLENIPIVRSGLISIDIAKILIERYFLENGKVRAIELGLLSS